MADILGGMAVGMTNGLLNNALAAWREDVAANRQFSHSEQAAENADKRARKLYKDFMSPEALLQQYKDAGLSPSLMFGGGGVGGQTPTGAQGNGSQQGSMYQPIDPMSGAQMQLMIAEANKANAEADRINGKNERGAAEIKKIIQETGNIELQKDFQALNNMLLHWQTEIEGNTLEEAIEARRLSLKRVGFELEELKETLRSLRVKAEIDENTEESVIKYITGRVIQQAAFTYALRTRGDLNKKGLEVSDAQIAELYSKVLYNSEVIRIEEGKLKINRDQLEAQIKQWEVENGLVERGQNIKIGEIVTHHIESGQDNMTSIIREVIPSIKLKPTNKIGFD